MNSTTNKTSGVEDSNASERSAFNRSASVIAIVVLLAAFIAMACADEKVVPKSAGASDQNASSSPVASPAANSAKAAPMSPGGDPIDTTKLDADIKGAEANHAKKPSDAAATKALASAYLARAGALTKARQYRAALGDYRRTLKYDPKNQEAREMLDQIVGIMQSMGREVPKEGEEPAPLPMPAKP